MSSIILNLPFRVKIAQSFFSLIISCDCMINHFQSFIRWFDFKLTASSSTCQYFAIAPSPESSNARLFTPLLLILYFNFYYCNSNRIYNTSIAIRRIWTPPWTILVIFCHVSYVQSSNNGANICFSHLLWNRLDSPCFAFQSIPLASWERYTHSNLLLPKPNRGICNCFKIFELLTSQN